MRSSIWMLSAILQLVAFGNRAHGQVPPVLSGPAAPAGGSDTKYRGPGWEFRDPRKRTEIWDERKLAYKQALSMLRTQARELSRWFQPNNAKTASLLNQIIEQARVMESAYDTRSADWAPWTVSLDVEQFLRQLRDAAYALKDINTKLKPILDQANGKRGGYGSHLYASAAGLPPGGQSDKQTQQIFRLLDDLNQDLQSKTNLDIIDVTIYTTQGGQSIGGYEIGCRWILSVDIYELLQKRTTFLAATLHGYSTPTKSTSFPTGVYQIFGTPDKGRDKKNRSPEKRVNIIREARGADRPSVSTPFLYTLEVK